MKLKSHNMIMQSGPSLRDTARRVLALWIAFVALSVIAPCQGAFALPHQGHPTNAHAITEAQGQAHQDKHVAGEFGTTRLDALHCIESPNPFPSKTKAASGSASGAFSLTAIYSSSPFSEFSSVLRLFTAQRDVRPQVFLKTSRLLI
jgi:hypothetical protein